MCATHCLIVMQPCAKYGKPMSNYKKVMIPIYPPPLNFVHVGIKHDLNELLRKLGNHIYTLNKCYHCLNVTQLSLILSFILSLYLRLNELV